LCQPLPPPPPNVNNKPPDPAPDLSTRDRFRVHSQDPACSGCHKLMDPIGFGFEAYDGIGRFRTQDGNGPVQTTGEIISTRDADGPFDGAVELATRLAASGQVRECVAKNWFRFASGRAETADDTCSVAAAYKAFQDS